MFDPSRLTGLSLLTGLACSEAPPGMRPPGSGDSDASDTASGSDCPLGMVEVAGGSWALGETDPTELARFEGTVIGELTVSVDAFCVAEYPFPGTSGAAWPAEGLSWDLVALLDLELPLAGRRLCSVAELLVAGAGPSNWRYPYDKDDYIEGICEVNDADPDPLGSYAGCESPAGVRDLQVRSAWGVLDAEIRDYIEPFYGVLTGEGAYGVWGGTSRRDTFYAPNNFGLHFHGPGEDAYLDDAWRPCADPGPATGAQEDAWDALVEGIGEAGYAGWLGR